MSVADRRGLDELAKGLEDLGWTIYATEGTANFLESKGIAVRRLSEITGLKETKRIKTLHPEVFERIYSGFFGMVVVNLYDPEEEIDVGGVALLRASAKCYDLCIPVCRPERYGDVLERLRSGVIDEYFRLELALEAFEYVVEYDRKVIEKLRRKIRNIRKT